MTVEIRKYPFEVVDSFELELNRRSPVLSVQVQKGVPVMWVPFDTEKQTAMRTFRVFGTGQPIEGDASKLKYVGTFQMQGGDFVGHLFEVSNGPFGPFTPPPGQGEE